MPVSFKLKTPIHGIAMETTAPGEKGRVRVRESLTYLDGLALVQRLDSLHGVLFAQIPEFPRPSQIDSLVVTLDRELIATAYVNEVRPVAQVKVKRALQAGETVFEADIDELLAYDIGVPVGSACGIVVVISHYWRRALFWDFSPLRPGGPERDYDLSILLGGLARSLIMGSVGLRPAQSAMQAAIEKLKCLLADRCERESEYQALLEENPWMLGGQHTLIERHPNLDDGTIPDFSGVRARDGFRDLFEIKQPFLRCFRQDGEFSADFLRGWEQAERYLWFARDNADYLQREKGLRFRNPRCFLLVGHGLSEAEHGRLLNKERNNNAITILTYEQVLMQARSLVALLEPASIVA